MRKHRFNRRALGAAIVAFTMSTGVFFSAIPASALSSAEEIQQQIQQGGINVSRTKPLHIYVENGYLRQADGTYKRALIFMSLRHNGGAEGHRLTVYKRDASGKKVYTPLVDRKFFVGKDATAADWVAGHHDEKGTTADRYILWYTYDIDGFLAKYDGIMFESCRASRNSADGWTSWGKSSDFDFIKRASFDIQDLYGKVVASVDTRGAIKLAGTSDITEIPRSEGSFFYIHTIAGIDMDGIMGRDETVGEMLSFLSADGKSVNVSKFVDSETFKQYVKKAAEKERDAQYAALTPQEKITYKETLEYVTNYEATVYQWMRTQVLTGKMVFRVVPHKDDIIIKNGDVQDTIRSYN